MSNRFIIGVLAILVNAPPVWAQDNCENRIGQGDWRPDPGFTAPMISTLPCTKSLRPRRRD
jgi:hypothetical protein